MSIQDLVSKFNPRRDTIFKKSWELHELSGLHILVVTRSDDGKYQTFDTGFEGWDTLLASIPRVRTYVLHRSRSNWIQDKVTLALRNSSFRAVRDVMKPTLNPHKREHRDRIGRQKMRRWQRHQTEQARAAVTYNPRFDGKGKSVLVEPAELDGVSTQLFSSSSKNGPLPVMPGASSDVEALVTAPQYDGFWELADNAMSYAIEGDANLASVDNETLMMWPSMIFGQTASATPERERSASESGSDLMSTTFQNDEDDTYFHGLIPLETEEDLVGGVTLPDPIVIDDHEGYQFTADAAVPGSSSDVYIQL